MRVSCLPWYLIVRVVILSLQPDDVTNDTKHDDDHWGEELNHGEEEFSGRHDKILMLEETVTGSTHDYLNEYNDKNNLHVSQYNHQERSALLLCTKSNRASTACCRNHPLDVLKISS